MTIVLLVVAAAAVVVIVVSGGDKESYKVRAIFDNAGFVIAGEDVKVAGVKIGAIDAVEVTDDFKAAVVLDITDAGYQDFRRDAECLVRPQSLIGERFIECELTQARAVGTDPPPALAQIDDGPGEGQYLLPVERNGKAVDLDLINNIMREPVRERLSIILSDLGIGVAGRGKDLADVIRRADPALKEVDEVLKILADQNDELESLAVNSDTILAPLARERRRVSSAIVNMSEVGEATAERREALEADIERLPTFLRELRPTMVRLGALSDEMTPVLSDLGQVAPDINRLVLQLGPFAQAGRPALRSLGEAAETGIPAVRAARPVIRDLRRLARAVRPVGASARRVLESFQRTDGIQRAMDYIFYQVAAINGFDSFGHYLRAGLIVNQCSNYATTPLFGCSSNFPREAAATAASGSSGKPRDPVLQRTAAVLARALGLGASEPAAAREKPARKRTKRVSAPAATEVPAKRQETAAAPQATPAPAPAAEPTPAPEQTDALLDYLFGGDE